MKKIKILVLFVLIFSFGFQSFSYTADEFWAKTNEYHEKIQKKVAPKLDRYSDVKLKKLIGLIDKLIEKTDLDTRMDEEKRFDRLALLYALEAVVIDENQQRALKDITITVIDDKRCVECYTDYYTNQLQQFSSLHHANLIVKDFSDEGVAEYMQENGIVQIPAAIFSSNDLGVDQDNIKSYISALPTGEYLYYMGDGFDPFIERSDRGFLVLDEVIYDRLQEDSYINGDENAQVSIYQFSDLECAACAQFNNDYVLGFLRGFYGDNNVNTVFKHFPLSYHEHAYTAAELVQCTGDQLGKDGYYSIIDTIYSNENPEKSFVIEESVSLGADEEKLNSCLDNGDFSDMIDAGYYNAYENLGINATPGFVIINNETKEYTTIIGGQDVDVFTETIDSLFIK